MEKQPDKKRGLLDDDDLDSAIANVDDTGMVKTEQELLEAEELRHLPPEDEGESP
jgi:hypothetical protein